MKKVLIKIFASCIFLGIVITPITSMACTYEEALNTDWSGYNYSDVVRILEEDMTEPSTLAPNQKQRCLISPMSDFYKEFDKKADGIKYEALTAISAMETGHFKSDVTRYYNNVGGMRNASGYMSFSSKEEGIKAMADLLVNNYLTEDGTYYRGRTIIAVSQNYNQSPHWVQMYVKVRLDMERRIKDVKPRYNRRSNGGDGKSKLFSNKAIANDGDCNERSDGKIESNLLLTLLHGSNLSKNLLVTYPWKILPNKEEESKTL